MAVRLTVWLSHCIYVSLSGRRHQFLVNINVVRNWLHRLWTQAMGSNTLSGSIICPSVHLFVCIWELCGFCNYINFQCGGPAPRCIYLESRAHRTPVGSRRAYMSVHPFVHPYVCISVSMHSCPCRFLEIISMACNCAQCMRPQATGSNTLSGSIICLSFVYLVVHRPFTILCLY